MLKTKIKTWRQYAKMYRFQGKKLLYELSSFDNSILVTGCQRSGTTILTRIIVESEDVIDFRFSSDDELDAALILSGDVAYSKVGRHCFQTTYVNEAYKEYLHHNNHFKMIWVVRNPQSVVYSMVHNWRRYTLDNLFRGTGASLLKDRDEKLYKMFGPICISRIKKACLSYAEKTRQLFELLDELGPENIYIADYDSMVVDPQVQLKKIFDFLDLPFDPCGEIRLHKSSVTKAQKLSIQENNMIDLICMDDYYAALDLRDK